MHSKFSKGIFLKPLETLFSGSFKALEKVRRNNFPVCKNISGVCNNIQIVRKSIFIGK